MLFYKGNSGNEEKNAAPVANAWQPNRMQFFFLSQEDAENLSSRDSLTFCAKSFVKCFCLIALCGGRPNTHL